MTPSFSLVCYEPDTSRRLSPRPYRAACPNKALELSLCRRAAMSRMMRMEHSEAVQPLILCANAAAAGKGVRRNTQAEVGIVAIVGMFHQRLRSLAGLAC